VLMEFNKAMRCAICNERVICNLLSESVTQETE
jgi:hypothetical protein